MQYIPPQVQTRLIELKSDIDGLKCELSSGRYDMEVMQEIAEELKYKAWQYRVLRSNYDVLYFAYEYFSDDRNPENENNLIPVGATFENAPDFHRELCNKLDELTVKPTKKIAWSVSRGHGKSAYLSNVFPVHQVVFKKRKYILIVSETESMAQRFVEWVGDQLKYNKKLRQDFGIMLHENKMANEMDNLEGFVTVSGTKVQSASIGKQLRGARFGAFRPDLVILDDLESAKNTNTKELREKNLHWFNSVIMPIGDITKTSYIYMGTLVHGRGLLPAVLQRSDFDSKIYSAIVSEPENVDLWNHVEEILRDVENPNREMEADNFYYANKEEMDKGARTLWNERFTYYDLLKIKINVGSRAFASEYLNKASDDDSCIFKRDYFAFYDQSTVNNLLRQGQLDVYSFWDIAIGKNSRSDYNAIVTIGRDRVTGVIYIIDAWLDKIPMHKALDVALQKIAQFRPRVFGVETVQAQYDMYRQLHERVMSSGLYATRVLPFNPKGRKEDRIEALEPLVESGYLQFSKGHRTLLEQMEMYPNADNDDGPDALASAVEIAGKQRKRTFYKKPKGL